MKEEFIEFDGHLVCSLFGDRYVFPGGRKSILSLPLVADGNSPLEKARRVAQMLKQAFPQKVTLSYESAAEVAEPVVEAVVEAAPPVEAPAPAKISKPAAKKSAKRPKK